LTHLNAGRALPPNNGAVNDPDASARRLRRFVMASLVLALASGSAGPSRAQAFPVPVPPSILAVPLLLLLIPVGIQLSRSDETEVRRLEAREDWAALVALASRRLAAHPGDVQWHELRGRALQRQGRCGEAIGDLRAVFEHRLVHAPLAADPAFDAGLALGLCEMALPDWDAAARTMTRLSTLAPSRWEPDYHLGVIYARRADTAAALAMVESLKGKSPGMAASLQAYLGASRAQALAGPETPQVAAPAAPAQRFIADGRLAVGSHALVLPPGAWYLGATSRHTVRGGNVRPLVARTTEVPVVTVHAYSLGADSSVAAVVAFSANPVEAYGISYWNVDDGCAASGTVYLKRFNRGFDQPECVHVRRVDAASALASARLGPALRVAMAAGASAPALSYEVHYERYAMDWAVAATVLVPVPTFADDVAAQQWAQALAEGLRPLSRQPGSAIAGLPPLGPSVQVPAPAPE
jgi:hypothetical protein